MIGIRAEDLDNDVVMNPVDSVSVPASLKKIFIKPYLAPYTLHKSLLVGWLF